MATFQSLGPLHLFMGWLCEVGTLDGAREAMGKDEIDAWLWEKFTTKHLVDNGEPWMPWLDALVGCLRDSLGIPWRQIW